MGVRTNGTAISHPRMALDLMRYAAVGLALLAIISVTPALAAGQEVHAVVRLQVGGADSDYPGCHGRILSFVGGSIEVGQPFFAEVLVDKMDSGGDSCLPMRASDDPDRPFAAAILTGPTARAGLGIGRRFASQHVQVGARVGQFINTRETYISGVAAARALVFVVGLEVGTVRGQWRYEDGYAERRWSNFGGLFAGLRL
jgi:hypothetical protein